MPLSAEAARLGAVEVELAGVLGETTVELHDLLAGSRASSSPSTARWAMPVDLRIDDATVAHAEVVVVDERYALRVSTSSPPHGPVCAPAAACPAGKSEP